MGCHLIILFLRDFDGAIGWLKLPVARTKFFPIFRHLIMRAGRAWLTKNTIGFPIRHNIFQNESL